MRKQLFTCFTLLLFFVSCKKDSIGLIVQQFYPDKGEPGDTVFIRGKSFGFSPSSIKVFFNGAQGSVTYVTDTLITAVVPWGATSGPVSVSIGSFTSYSKSDFFVYPGVWLQKADLPSSGRTGAAGFFVGGKAYIGTGNDGTQPLDDLWQYDETSNGWTQKATVPLAIEDAAVMVINGKAYLGSGKAGNGAIDDFWQYDETTDAWITKAKFPGFKRFGAVAFGVGDKGYAGTGELLADHYTDDWWQYDPATDTWTKKTDFPGGPRAGLTGFVINGKIYCGLGNGHNDWWEYDPATDTWTQKSNHPITTVDAKGFAINGKGYIAGGGDQCWQYDATTDTWTRNAFFGYRVGSAAFEAGDKAYYGTGAGLQGTLQKDFWQFTPGQ